MVHSTVPIKDNEVLVQPAGAQALTEHASKGTPLERMRFIMTFRNVVSGAYKAGKYFISNICNCALILNYLYRWKEITQ